MQPFMLYDFSTPRAIFESYKFCRAIFQKIRNCDCANILNFKSLKYMSTGQFRKIIACKVNKYIRNYLRSQFAGGRKILILQHLAEYCNVYGFV